MTTRSTASDTASTIITITLPPVNGDPVATLLIQRGDLAHLSPFQYVTPDDITAAIQDASTTLTTLQDNPPVIPALPDKQPVKRKKKTKAGTSNTPVIDDEPTIDVPLKKGTRTIKMRHIQIVTGDSDAAAYRLALKMAGQLIDGTLWDGESPIYFEDVYATHKKMGHLTAKELEVLFGDLHHFVQTTRPTSQG